MRPSEKSPRVPSLVRFRPTGKTSERVRFPFSEEKVYVFLGELANMPGHCVVAEHPSGRIFSGFHIENFGELDQNEM